MMSKNTKIKLTIACCIVVATLGIISVLLIDYFTDKSNYTTIDNFNDYYYSVPQKTKNLIFSTLNNTIRKNVSGDIPTDGAIIRSTEPYLYDYNINYDGYSGEFIVDIPAIQQSYLVNFNFNEDPEAFTGGYEVLIYCISGNKMIYPDFGCEEDLPFIKEADR